MSLSRPRAKRPLTSAEPPRRYSKRLASARALATDTRHRWSTTEVTSDIWQVVMSFCGDLTTAARLRLALRTRHTSQLSWTVHAHAIVSSAVARHRAALLSPNFCVDKYCPLLPPSTVDSLIRLQHATADSSILRSLNADPEESFYDQAGVDIKPLPNNTVVIADHVKCRSEHHIYDAHPLVHFFDLIHPAEQLESLLLRFGQSSTRDVLLQWLLAVNNLGGCSNLGWLHIRDLVRIVLSYQVEDDPMKLDSLMRGLLRSSDSTESMRACERTLIAQLQLQGYPEKAVYIRTLLLWYQGWIAASSRPPQ